VDLPAATYRVTYNLTGANTASGVLGSMVVTTAGTGTFITQALPNAGETTITVTSLFTGFCSTTISANNTATISLHKLLGTTSSTTVDTYCAVDGTATVNPAEGSGSYAYQWSNGGTTQTITGLSAGIYPVTVTDNTYGCTATFSVPVSTTYNNVCPGKDGDITYSAGGVVNTYYPGNTVAAGSSTITLGTARGSATAFSSGDLALIIQMQGADIISANTSAYGQVSNVVAGTYEYAKVSSYSGGVLTLSSSLVNSYTNDLSGRKTFQVIRVPQFNTLTLSSNIYALDWNGQTGGVVAIDVARSLSLAGNTISADGKGFRGGACVVSRIAQGPLPIYSDFVFANSILGHGTKGEGVAGTPDNLWYNSSVVANTYCLYPTGQRGMGAAGNAGGGGNDPASGLDNGDNAGGGGGSNLAAGGKGGNSWQSNLPTGGNGGYALSGAPTKIYLGGGGGSGTANNYALGHGGTGGGIVIVHAGTIADGGTLTANGSDGIQVLIPPAGDSYGDGNDGGGGGGGGGTIIVTANTGLNLITGSVNGGQGANTWEVSTGGTTYPGNHHGPGGGGSGGVVYRNFTTSTASVSPGLNGTSCTDLDPFGAAQGSPGQVSMISESNLTTTTFGRKCKVDNTPPTVTCPSNVTVCYGNVPAAITTMAGFNASDSQSGINGPPACIRLFETGSQESGTITRTYYIFDNAGNYSTCTQTITILPTVSYGTLASSDETICNGGDPSAIGFTTAPSGGTGTFAYQWYYKDGMNTCPTGTSSSGWTSISGATTNSYDPPAGLTTSRTYAVMVDA
ncbi:MAG TPA: hypothetical protein PKG48_14875, partial [Bacteroidales bacterium]|nr:hypothetical protein [Bacteroidales bacterium]